MKGLSADDVTWSTRAEPSLWDDRDRFDQAQMDALRASEFHEIGRSGRRWSRQELLDADEQTIAAVIHDPEVRPVTDAVALARHVSTQSPRGKSDGHGRPAHLTSVWRRKGAWPTSPSTRVWVSAADSAGFARAPDPADTNRTRPDDCRYWLTTALTAKLL